MEIELISFNFKKAKKPRSDIFPIRNRRLFSEISIPKISRPAKVIGFPIIEKK